MANEEVKRLAPKTDVARELYLKSGNQCAFPGCNERIVNSEGVLIGEICHIEAAETKGPRFNENMTNEDRRQFSNLLLMCHPHHKTTDDVIKYEIERMREIKSNHERRFTDVVALIRDSVVDRAAAKDLHLPRTLNSINGILRWGNDPGQLSETNKSIRKLAKSVHALPDNTKELLVIIIQRSSAKKGYQATRVVPLREIIDVCGLSGREVVEQVRVMERYGIATGCQDEEDGIEKIELRHLGGDWDFWRELKRYCKVTGVTLHEVIVDLRFDKLDAV